MQLICLDEQHFPKIREKNGVLVDKTKTMHALFKNGGYFFLSRPRRFGKSLLCSTLAALFAAKRDLFKGLWIENSAWAWEGYPVLHFDMTRASAPDSDAHIVKRKIFTQLKIFATAFELELGDVADVAEGFGLLIKKVYEKTGKQVVVIVDEYDKPLLDVIEHKDRYMAIQEVLRGFYGQLKASSEYLRFVLLTGVFKFAKTSVFSGLNNIKDLTFDPESAELLGYTEQELIDNFPEQLDGLCRKFSKTRVELLEVLKEKYNGYSFGIDTDTEEIMGSVYNPFALNYVLSDQRLVERWFTSATPTLLIQRLKEQSFIGIDVTGLTVPFSILEDSCNPDNLTPVLLLYYAGYVTLKSYNARQKKITLDFPNAEVAQAFSLSLLPAISNKDLTSFGAITSKINDILYGKDLTELKDVLNQALAQMPYFMFGTQESYYQTVIYLFFNASAVVTVAEDLMNRGRADITVLLPEVIYIFELKMNRSATIALEQIKKRDYAAKYRHQGREIYAVGVELSSGDRIVKDLLVEKLS